jgi:putative membrane protein
MTPQFRKSAMAAALLSIAFGASAAPLANEDKEFITKTALDGMTEVELGTLASQKAVSPKVKAFGLRMKKDHANTNEDLGALARAKELPLPAKLDAGHSRDVAELGQKAGADFDREYMEMMVKDHKKDVTEFEKQAKSSKDPDVRSFATRTLPALKEHLKLAESVRSDIKKK